MKYKLNVNDQTYEVEIENLNARPIVVRVDGQRFKVMPETGRQVWDGDEAESKTDSKAPPPAPAQSQLDAPASDHRVLTAPLPGTIIEVFIKPGEKVEAGQVVLIIEAMKMKNSIRSIYSGVVDKVLVNQGQSVTHKQALMEFSA